jgi:predicted DNA-binding transcriptional regulator YafY
MLRMLPPVTLTPSQHAALYVALESALAADQAAAALAKLDSDVAEDTRETAA